LSQWTFSAPLTDFLQRCLKFEPSKRATASELRKHEFLEKACDKEDMQNLIRQIFLQESAAAATSSSTSRQLRDQREGALQSNFLSFFKHTNRFSTQ
jgi:serine/threonine protein kinase